MGAWLDIILKWAPVVAQVLPAVSSGIVAVLHATGADQHRTVAGDIAKALKDAGEAAEKVHKYLLNGQAPNTPQTTNPPT